MSKLVDNGDVDLVVHSLRSIQGLNSPELATIKTQIAQGQANLQQAEIEIYEEAAARESDIAALTSDLNLTPIDKKSLLTMWAKVYSDTTAPCGLDEV